MDQLKTLHLLDGQVRGLRSRMDGAMSRVSVQNKRQEQLGRQHVELGQQQKQLQARASGLETEANSIDQRVDKLREQMNAVNNNKEYSALLVEVNTLKLDKSKLEDEALEHLAEIDKASTQLQELQQRLTEQAKLVASAEAEVQAARDQIGSRLEELTAERDVAAAEIPPDILTAFERLADAYESGALSKVQEQDRRRMEYTCGGCYMTIPVEHVSSLMSRPDQLTYCPNCNRILCIEQDLKTAICSK